MSSVEPTSTGEHTMLGVFNGRHDAYFDSWKYARGAEVPGALVYSTEQEWHAHFEQHCDQQADIGVYPRIDDGTCMWGCIDIDSGDFSEALTTWASLGEVGVDSWIEASKSKGFHVWVFASDWVEAHAMRPLLVEVARSAGLPDKVEINPKQVHATKKGFGNCVRLPYGRWSVEHPGRCCMVYSPDGEYRDFSREQFLEMLQPTDVELIRKAGGIATDRQNLRKAAKAATDRLRQHEAHQPPYGAGSLAKNGGQHQRAWKILNGLDRAADGERNQCAFVIACHLKGSGVPEHVARTRMVQAVERSFDGGLDFIDEALAVLERQYQL